MPEHLARMVSRLKEADWKRAATFRNRSRKWRISAVPEPEVKNVLTMMWFNGVTHI
jgi:hypothetical protein